MNKILTKEILTLSLAALVTFFSSCGKNLNTNNDVHFTADGCLVSDSALTTFVPVEPSSVKFYVEVSGSMNGFFRANRPTQFKSDLWYVLSYYSPISPEICILTNDGNQGSTVSHSSFQTLMNTGAFISTASTKVPLMLQTIIDNLDTNSNEVAVLVSDMKYSPVGAAAPEVLLTQYSTDISKILGKFGKAVSLICATSDYLDREGRIICDRSPYYFLLLGNPEQVAPLRNEISTLLLNRGHFIDNIESGFDYGKTNYSFGVVNKCEQPEDSVPTFINYEDEEDGDTCTINLNINLENYRWLVSNKDVFQKSFVISTIYGSNVSVDNVTVDAQNITGSSKILKRKSVASVSIKLFNMKTDSEVIEWKLDLPDTDYTLFNEFFIDATDENDPSKSYSVIDFLKGIFYGGVVNKELGSNYILVSKNN